jgi:hypothetical protein
VPEPFYYLVKIMLVLYIINIGMASNNRRWRDRQINNFQKFQQKNVILEQEKLMLDFMSNCGVINWRWEGDHNEFKKICASQHNITGKEYNGIIIFGNCLYGHTTKSLIAYIKKLIENVTYAYVGINRYVLDQHNLLVTLPDDIGDSLDIIMTLCHPNFKRLHRFSEIDGDHMVAAHPMDCYGLCK